jgi:hypothetical protein
MKLLYSQRMWLVISFLILPMILSVIWAAGGSAKITASPVTTTTVSLCRDECLNKPTTKSLCWEDCLPKPTTKSLCWDECLTKPTTGMLCWDECMTNPALWTSGGGGSRNKGGQGIIEIKPKSVKQFTVQPKKVKTVVVRADGTIITSAGTKVTADKLASE